MKAAIGYASPILDTTKNPRPTTQQWAIGRGFLTIALDGFA